MNRMGKKEALSELYKKCQIVYHGGEKKSLAAKFQYFRKIEKESSSRGIIATNSIRKLIDNRRQFNRNSPLSISLLCLNEGIPFYSCSFIYEFRNPMQFPQWIRCSTNEPWKGKERKREIHIARNFETDGREESWKKGEISRERERERKNRSLPWYSSLESIDICRNRSNIGRPDSKTREWREIWFWIGPPFSRRTYARVALSKGVKISFRIREWRFYRPRVVDSGGMKSGAEINPARSSYRSSGPIWALASPAN